MSLNDPTAAPCRSQSINIHNEEVRPLLSFSARFLAPINRSAAQLLERELAEVDPKQGVVSVTLVGLHFEAFRSAVRTVFLERPTGRESERWERQARAHPRVLSILLRCKPGELFSEQEKAQLHALVPTSSLRGELFGGGFRPRTREPQRHGNRGSGAAPTTPRKYPVYIPRSPKQ